MAGIENLFAIEPTLPNVQGLELPEDVEKWSEKITTYLRELYPDVARLPMFVEVRNRDDKSGTAIGAIHIASIDAKKTMLVPFIVNKFKMSPLDIWMEKKTQAVHPLQKDTFKEQFFSTSAGEIDARPTDAAGQYFNDPSLWTTNYPPLQGRYSYASAGYPILDSISDTISKEDGERFKKTFIENPGLALKFQKNAQTEIITKLAQKVYVNSNDYKASAISLIPASVINVKRELDKYSILSCVEGLFDTLQTVKMDREGLEKFLGKVCAKPQDFLNDVDMEGEKMLIVRKPSDSVFLYDLMEARPEEANDFASFIVKTKTGLELEGVVIPKVVDFSGKAKPYKLFLSKTHSAIQKSIAGVRQKTSDVMEKVLKPADIRLGQTGVFVYIDDGKAIATVPVTISAIEKYGNQFDVVDMEGKHFKVRQGYGSYFEQEEAESKGPVDISSSVSGQAKFKRVYLDAHGMIETRKGIFVIPQKMMWIPIQPGHEVTSTPNEWMQKEASKYMDFDPLNIVYTGIVYDISGNGMAEKLATDERGLKVFLAHHGVSQEKIAHIIKKAKHERVKVHGVDKMKTKAEKTKPVAELMAKISAACNALKKDLIKEAAEMADSQTVDAMLSLNFINPENVAKFVSYKPVLDKVADYLAELTLAARLGATEIPEFASVSAMNKILEVSDGLGKLELTMKRPSSKAK